MERTKKAVLTAVYSVGTLIVAVLLVTVAAGPKRVPFPDAMLPMELRELAGAWLAIGFLPMALVSAGLYKTVRKKAVLIPAGICLAAVLFWVGAWTVGMIRSPLMSAGGDIALPEAGEIESVHLTGSELDVAIIDDAFIEQLLERLSRAVNTGRASVQDVPNRGEGLVQVNLYFRQGGASTLFLYQGGGDLLVEQPYQGIYRTDDSLEPWLREQITIEMAREVEK